METDTKSTETAAGNPTAQVSNATAFSRENRLGLMLRTVVFRIFARMTKKYTMEMVLAIIVATAAPDTSMPNPNGMVSAPLNTVSPCSKMKMGSRMIFRIPPRERPIPASFVFPTARTRWPKIRPATVGIPPMTNTQNRYRAEKLNVSSSALKNVKMGFINTPRITARTAVTTKLAQNPKADAFFAVRSSFLPRLLAMTLFAPMPNRLATAVSSVKMGKVMDRAAS